MKLLYCLECHDVVRLHRKTRACECGLTGGRYVDDSQAEVFGDGVPFALQNTDFHAALTRRTDDWPGTWFRGFVIPRNADNITKVDDGSRT